MLSSSPIFSYVYLSLRGPVFIPPRLKSVRSHVNSAVSGLSDFVLTFLLEVGW